MTSLQISAVICTFNRVSYLRKAIQSLVNQTLERNHYEILIVDNHSTDNTKQVAIDEFAYIQNLRYIYEPIQGLSRARNTGWQNARAEYVAYLDDDAIAYPDWLEKILAAFASIKPRPGCVGGKIEPIWEEHRPPWLSSQTAVFLGILDSSPVSIVSYNDSLFAGGNSAFPKSALASVNGFKEFLGRKGKKLSSCEEILLWHELKKQGHTCYYDPNIAIKHHIPAFKLTKLWVMQRMFWEGFSEAKMNLYLEHFSYKRRFQKGIIEMLRLLKSPHILINLINFFDHNPKTFDNQCYFFSRVAFILTILKVIK